jgi:hypothetical protein
VVNLPGALMDVQADVSIDSYGSLTLLNAGTFRKSGGTAVTYINTSFFNTGTLDAQTGIINLTANYSLTGGRLNFGINSLTNFGQISLSGSPATLDGNVSANLNNGYVPATGSSFGVVNYGSQGGMFTNFNLPFAVAWQTNYGASSFSLSVLNVRPSLAAITNQTVDELLPLSVNASANDPDIGQSLTFALVSNPPGMTIKPVSGIINWTPAQTQSPSTNTVVVSVTDNGTPPLSATNQFTVVVKEVNVAPTLPAVSTQIVNELTLLTVTNSATNFNIHSAVTGYALVNPPTNMAVSTGGIITWTPAQAQSPSTNVITTIVTNSNPYDAVNSVLASTNQFMVVVKEVNIAPVLPVIPVQTVNAQALLTVTNAAAESNIHANVGYALVNPPDSMGISAGGVITWTPARLQGPGTNVITTVVTNTDLFDSVNPHLSATNSFTVIVYAPTLSPIGNYTVNAGRTVSFTASATDNDPTRILTYGLVNPPTGATINGASGLFSWRVPASFGSTTNTVQVNVTDNSAPSLSDAKSFTVTVNPLAPVILTPLGYTNGQFKLQVNGPSGPDYIISAGGTLTNWTDLVTNILPITPPFLFTDTNAPSTTNRFYRARLVP